MSTEAITRSRRLLCQRRYAAVAVLLVGMGGTAPGAAGRVDTRAAATVMSAGSGRANLIIVLNGKCTRAREAALRQAGADVYRHLPLIHGVALSIPIRAQSRLAALPFVTHVSPDLGVTKCDEFTVGSSGADTAYQQTGFTGTGIGVAVLDSGVQPCADLGDPVTGSSRIVANVNFVSGSTTTNDRCGHGTHVAGIIAGNAACSTGGDFFRPFMGIARGCNIVNVKVLNISGQGTVSGVVAGLQWVVNNRATYNIRVVNLSLGHPQGESYTTDPLCQAVEAVWQSGIVVVCAAGNAGRLSSSPTPGASNEGYGTAYGSIQSPANDPYVITVGATKSLDGVRADDRIATYSSRGPTRLDFVLKPDLVAPGNRVVSLNDPNSTLYNTYSSTNLIPFSYYCNNSSPAVSSRYYRLSGTSMAAPVVSGAAVLMLQADPTLSPDTVKARLMISADKWALPDGTMDACTFGAGYLNIPAALSNTTIATQPALSPTLYRDSQGGVHINIAGLLGNSQYIWGDADDPTLQYIWGEADNPLLQYIWGENTLASSQYIWGQGVWNDQYVWGETSTAVDLTSTAITGEP